LRRRDRSIERSISLTLKGARANIFNHEYRGYELKTLVIAFSAQREALSSREGFKNVEAICNTYTPPPLWGSTHKAYTVYQNEVTRDLGLSKDRTCFLSTGADVDKLFLKEEWFNGIKVCVFVTGGAKSNAMRVGVDLATCFERDGKFEEIGTINTIILTNVSFTRGAMVRSVITATEAKTIAFQDLNIRSSCTPLKNQATGTGTDNIIIVSGDGPRITYVGGHSKIGELMAKATTLATKEVILKSR
jgi:adenosylcobinamide hydrolase